MPHTPILRVGLESNPHLIPRAARFFRLGCFCGTRDREGVILSAANDLSAVFLRTCWVPHTPILRVGLEPHPHVILSAPKNREGVILSVAKDLSVGSLRPSHS